MLLLDIRGLSFCLAARQPGTAAPTDGHAHFLPMARQRLWEDIRRRSVDEAAPMTSSYRLPLAGALAALAFAGMHLGFEYFDGGVRSHHVLNRADLPEISNWFGLIILPALGWAFGVRLRNRPGARRSIWVGLVASLAYGAALATSFELGATDITKAIFFGLLPLAIIAPIYRAECMLGFVAGMTFTFGAILPCIFAVLFAGLSAALRLGFVAIRKRLRPNRGASAPASGSGR
ncbi:hypothetical protein [Lysobacter sp. ESA13C]|uniref:hypothetical protein n=1 Tax=Lysobacter sp. ESA13C TaxID=2862676 RepID=UPI001CC136B4|nr:hypothetical protein [Lysobacter sp. ESA13C]